MNVIYQIFLTVSNCLLSTNEILIILEHYFFGILYFDGIFSRSSKTKNLQTIIQNGCVDEVEAGSHPDDVPRHFNIKRSNVIKWVKNKSKIAAAAASSEYRNHLKIRLSTKYVELYKELEKKFKECRAKGYCISFAWL